jgi:hypothetical protein
VRKLLINLPLHDQAEASDAHALHWLLQRMETEHPDGLVALRPCLAQALEIGLSGDDLTPIPCAVKSPAAAKANARDNVEIAAGMHLAPSRSQTLISFFKEYPPDLDHIGFNLSKNVLPTEDWRALIAGLSARTPLFRLDVGAPNDIVIAILRDRIEGKFSIVELVHDQSGAQTSVHICVRTPAPRSVLETAFPAPFGGYKPGDEAFFRSVAFLPELAIPAFIDIAFSDGSLTPWPQIVAAMGKRIDP